VGVATDKEMLAQFEAQWKDEQARHAKAQALDDVYRGRDEEIIEYLKGLLVGKDKMFGAWENKLEIYLPTLPHIIRRWAGVYRDRPNRKLSLEGGKDAQSANERLTPFLTDTRWAQMLAEIERSTLLYDVLPVVVTEDVETHAPRIEIWKPCVTVMVPKPTNPLQPERLWRLVKMPDKIGCYQDCWEMWDDEHHAYFKKGSKGIPGDRMMAKDLHASISPEDENKYNRLPAVVFRLFTDDLWGPGAYNLLRFYVMHSLGLITMADQIGKQTFDQLWFKDVDLQQMLASNVDLTHTEEVPTLKLGRNRPMILERRLGSQSMPEAGVISFNSHLPELAGAMTEMAKMLAAMTGVPAYEFTGEGRPESGVAIWQRERPLREMWTENRDTFRGYEQELYKLTATVWNACQDRKSAEQLPEEATLVVDYAEVGPDLTPDEEWIEIERKAQYGLISPVDLYREYNPDTPLDDEAILKVMAENRGAFAPTQKASPEDDKRSAIRERLSKAVSGGGSE
jgi:hypothetical protein